MELRIERAVAGGRMLARHEGGIVLVAGAIPGELVRARIERTTRHVSFARVEDVIEASPDRRDPVCDPLCGGMDYAHIAYDAQLDCKREIVRDAMRRIGRVTLDESIPVAGSPERGYRLRARLHVSASRAGFFLEGTHTLCDAAATGQLLPEAIIAVNRAIAAAGAAAKDVTSVLVAENVEARRRVVHLERRRDAPQPSFRVEGALDDTVSGITTAGQGSDIAVLAGSPCVTDTAASLFRGAPPVPPSTTWTRHAPSFFQGNRFLVGALADAVLGAVDGQRILDLYAGVGLFSVMLAAAGRTVAAVEGDRVSARDLRANAGPYQPHLHVSRKSVEEAVAAVAAGSFETVVVDPPRTGISSDALRGIAGVGARRIVYVSCDPATLARDAAVLLRSGYTLGDVRLFDLFPNTAHVETLAVFTRGKG